MGADLRGADLQGADLHGADLRGADLHGADLQGADLRGADLQGAYLRGADLHGADLQGAYLRGAYLMGAGGINKFLSTPLLMLLDQPGKIRAYKLVNGQNQGPYHCGITYQIGSSYKCDACEDDTIQCAEGISLATLDWCMKEWREGCKILIAEFEPSDIAAIPIATDGKFRVSGCSIVGEKDLVEIGLLNKSEGK